MKISTIKTLFNKTSVPPQKGNVAVAKVSDKSKKIVALKSVVKKTAVKKAPPKKSTVTSKSIVKKTAVKKVATKKTVSQKPLVKKDVLKKTVKEIKLVVASDSQSFWLQDGQILNSLPALEVALKGMSVATYKYHALTDGNHFADWVELVLADKVCADALRTIKTAASAHTVVKKHLTMMS